MQYDLQQFAVAATGSTSTVELPEIKIRAQLCDQASGEVALDLTGDVACVVLPRDLALLSADQLVELLRPVAPTLLNLKAGVS